MTCPIKSILSCAFFSGVLMAISGPAHAATYHWTGPDNGVWNNAANWSPRQIPGSADSVVVDAKKIVSVPADVTVANLSVGEGAEVKNSGKIKVTNTTNSLGLFTGTGTLDIPAGATAIYNVTATGSRQSTRGFCQAATTAFAPISNKGTLITKVAAGNRVDFAAFQNSGTMQIVSDGAVTFKSIKNTQNLDISGSGKVTLGNIDNATGATLVINAATAPSTPQKRNTLTTRSLFSSNDSSDSDVIYLNTLTNRAGGTVKLLGSKTGRYFEGAAIYNAGNLQISGAQTLLESNVSNSKGAVLSLDSDASILSADGTAPQLNNAGKLIKPAGSDATLAVDWTNNGQVVVENGTLHVRVPSGETCEQTAGTTTLEGGVLSVEDATGVNGDGTLDVAGGVLNGIGTIDGNVLNSGGHVAPGHSPGTITINGNFTQTANGVLDMEIGGTDPGTSYDQILVNGTAYLDGTLDWVRWQGFVPSNGDVYTLFTYYSKVGNFANFVDTSPVAGISYDTTLTPTDYEVNCYGTPTGGPPIATITNPLNNAAATSMTSATGTSSANGSSAVTGVTCRLYRYTNPVTGVAAGFWAGGSTWTASATAANERPVSGTTAWTFAFPTLVAGRYSLRATATNADGITASSATNAFWVDPNVPSVLTIDTPANGASVSSLTAINGTVSDASDGSGILSVQGRLKRNSDNLYWNGSGWYSPVYSFTTTLSGTKWARTTSLPSGATNLKTGTYTITSIATDRAGNTKTVTSTFTVTSSGGGS
ncbi:hypothetical protein IAD21_00459 [Abditibacteriota bacterium]|nr:hypothetical protein IAD21_00459 [Abditibacteriota bacterium]